MGQPGTQEPLLPRDVPVPWSWYPGRHCGRVRIWSLFLTPLKGSIVGNVWDLGVKPQQVDLAILPK